MIWKKEELLKNYVDYIKIEGEGFGRIEVKGTMTGSPVCYRGVHTVQCTGQ